MTFEETRRSRVMWRIAVQLCPRALVTPSLLDRPAITRQPPEYVAKQGRRRLREGREVRETQGGLTAMYSSQSDEQTLLGIGRRTHKVARSGVQFFDDDTHAAFEGETFEGVGEVGRHV